MQAKWYDPGALVIYGILGAIGAGVIYSLYRIPKDVMDAQALLNPPDEPKQIRRRRKASRARATTK